MSANERTGSVSPHYNSAVQLWDIIPVCFGNRFFEGNIAKYITRFDRKGTPTADLAKAIHYLDKLKELIRAAVVGPIRDTYIDSPTINHFLADFFSGRPFRNDVRKALTILATYGSIEELEELGEILNELFDESLAQK